MYTEGKTLQRCRSVNRGLIGTGQVAGTEKMEGWAEGLGREPWAWGLGLGPGPWGWQVCLVERRCRGVGVLLGFADGCFLVQLTVLILGPPGGPAFPAQSPDTDSSGRPCQGEHRATVEESCSVRCDVTGRGRTRQRAGANRKLQWRHLDLTAMQPRRPRKQWRWPCRGLAVARGS